MMDYSILIPPYMDHLLTVVVQYLLMQSVSGNWRNGKFNKETNDSSHVDSKTITGTYCQWEKMNITCRSGEVIVMSSARYGRMQPGRCVSRSYGAIGCSTDVLGHLDLVCSGRQSCQLVVPDERLREIRPCPIDFAAYLEISYRCVSVVRPDIDTRHETPSCFTRSQPYRSSSFDSGRFTATDAIPSASVVPATSPIGTIVTIGNGGDIDSKGYIASSVTDRTGVGSVGCPWVLKAAQWQRISITLLDFTAGMNAEATLPPYRVFDSKRVPSPTSDLASYDTDVDEVSINGQDVPGTGQMPMTFVNVNSDDGVDDRSVPTSSIHRGRNSPTLSSGVFSGFNAAYRGSDESHQVSRHQAVDQMNGVGSYERLQTPSRPAQPNNYCHKYAVVRERLPRHHQSNDATTGNNGRRTHHRQGDRESLNRGTIVCGDTSREKVVYLSATNEVEVELFRSLNVPGLNSNGSRVEIDEPESTPSSDIFFLLHYETIGCPTLPAPFNGWHERTGSDVMVVGCNATKERWYLHCDGRRWIGEWKNCTSPSFFEETEEVAMSADWSSPFGILIVSACGVAVGLIIGTFLLTVMLFFIRRKRRPFLGTEPVFVSVPQGGSTTAEGCSLSPYHFGACVVRREGPDGLANQYRDDISPTSSACTGTFCGESNSQTHPQHHHHHNHHHHQPQQNSTLHYYPQHQIITMPCGSSNATYGIVPRLSMAAASFEDEDAGNGTAVDPFVGCYSTANGLDSMQSIDVIEHIPMRDGDLLQCNDNNGVNPNASGTAPDFCYNHHTQSRLIQLPFPPPPSTLITATTGFSIPSSYNHDRRGTMSYSTLDNRCIVACDSCSSGVGSKSSADIRLPPGSPSSKTLYGLLRRHQLTLESSAEGTDTTSYRDSSFAT